MNPHSETMKKTIILTLLILASAICVAAQKKQRIGLEEGANSVQVKGKIAGRQYALYEISVSKGDVWDVKLTSANEFIGYTVKAPNGDRYDFLEPAPQDGIYVIRVELNSTGAKSKKAANFTLDVSFEMEPSAPIS